MARFIVCGGRTFGIIPPDTPLARAFDEAARVVLEGGADGADMRAREWAAGRGIEFRTFRADWDGLGRAAGPKRNKRMLEEGRPAGVIAFAGGPGTRDMVRQAEEAGVQVYRIGW